ncbi:conserved membrane hypothetical protein [Desulfamplus magnetovallimortis]|uniref:EamA domain-containing protein n=1 Tax=Desulfamplus magnetovallimortis TaxID=1246637 RepID=A0A1W1HHS8_9BACT|nr:DMT family transporter [Desulfamplus magnetovallimortis]SLM32034.1 conserved membrane hypothetical protein [Desulfamplus magnetovallimortis]
MQKNFQGLLTIHISVLLFSMSGLFGKFLHISPKLIVFGRTAFASIVLVMVLHILKIPVRYKNRKDLMGFLVMGAILAVHWVTFFYSIQISTVAIGLLSFSSYPIFVTFLEPLFFNEKLLLRDIGISLIVFSGLVLVVPEFDLSNNLTLGALWGTVSGFTFALLSILNKKYLIKYSSLTIAFYQDGIACMALMPFIGGEIFDITPYDIGMVAILGVVFTALAHTLFIQGMVRVKAQLASIITCLEPVYGILFAMVLLGEIPSIKVLGGGVIIIGGILYATYQSRANASNV